MRKSLILGVVLFTMLSCASVRKATPIAVDDLKTYPVAGESSKATPSETTSQAQQTQTSARNTVQQKPESKEQKPSSSVPLSQQVIEYARTFTGVPYKLGARGPKQFDCSGFTTYVFKHFGYTITPFSQSQFKEGREVASYSDIQPGDLVFFGARGSVRNIAHVGIVVSVNREGGSFNFIHASASRGVTEDSSNHPYFMMRYMGARRILPDE